MDWWLWIARISLEATYDPVQPHYQALYIRQEIWCTNLKATNNYLQSDFSFLIFPTGPPKDLEVPKSRSQRCGFPLVAQRWIDVETRRKRRVRRKPSPEREQGWSPRPLPMGEQLRMERWRKRRRKRMMMIFDDSWFMMIMVFNGDDLHVHVRSFGKPQEKMGYWDIQPKETWCWFFTLKGDPLCRKKVRRVSRDALIRWSLRWKRGTTIRSFSSNYILSMMIGIPWCSWIMLVNNDYNGS